MRPVRRLPKYCVEDVDRYGTIRVYFRRKGQPKIRIEGTPWSPEFMATYDQALSGTMPKPTDGRRVIIPATKDTWRWLCQEYFGRSADYRLLDPSTRTSRRRILEGTFDEPIKPGSPLRFGDMPVAKFGRGAIAILRDRKVDTPHAANETVKAIRAVFRWAVDDETLAAVTTNPGEDVRYFKRASEGHHTWTVEEVRQFEAQHPIGTTPRLALALLLYTGARRSDVVRLGPQMISDGWLRFTVRKGRLRRVIQVEIPVLPALQSILDASPTGHLAFLVTHHGKTYSETGFSNRMRDWCNEAGLPHCTAHGLRKAGATIAANNGATTKQLMAIFGWLEPEQAEHYTQRAERRRLAGAAMGLIDMGQTGYKGVPPAAEIRSSGTETTKKTS
jgi:integrase